MQFEAHFRGVLVGLEGENFSVSICYKEFGLEGINLVTICPSLVSLL